MAAAVDNRAENAGYQVVEMSATDAAMQIGLATTCKSIGVAFFGGGLIQSIFSLGFAYVGYGCATGFRENETRSQLIGVAGLGTTTAASWAVAWTVAPVAAIPVTIGGALITTLALAPEARGALYRKFCHLVSRN